MQRGIQQAQDSDPRLLNSISSWLLSRLPHALHGQEVQRELVDWELAQPFLAVPS